MTINKELALIAKDKGFKDYSSYFYCYDYLNLEGDEELHCIVQSEERRVCKRTNVDAQPHIAVVPESETLLDWIFSKVYIKPEDSPEFAAKGVDELEWLSFWYNTLIEHKFTLMGEFISRLEEWLESNEIIMLIHYDWITYDVEILQWGREEVIKLISTLSGKTPYCFTTKKKATHEAILQCFKLLKESYGK